LALHLAGARPVSPLDYPRHILDLERQLAEGRGDADGGG
jgi:hypothetical protein